MEKHNRCRLLKEAEWEYAAKAGMTSVWISRRIENHESVPAIVAVYRGNRGAETRKNG
jgi:formylglycine-generating enzyme required for sulfatase activity